MKLLLRQSCVFMLLILQVFAPLVHAHIGISADDNSVHIHNSHTHISIKSSESAEPLQVLQHSDVVIALSPVIKEKNDLTDLFSDLYVQQHLRDYLQLLKLEQNIDFPDFFNTSQTNFKFLVTAPRAPPPIYKLL